MCLGLDQKAGESVRQRRRPAEPQAHICWDRSKEVCLVGHEGDEGVGRAGRGERERRKSETTLQYTPTRAPGAAIGRQKK